MIKEAMASKLKKRQVLFIKEKNASISPQRKIT